jgi:hypothetical protein
VPADEPKPIHRAIAWSKDDPYGSEYADIQLIAGSLTAAGVAIGSDPVPYRLDYTLTTGPEYLTSSVIVKASGDGWRRALQMRRKDGKWEASTEQTGRVELPEAGGDLAKLDDALDPDLGLSPLFNTMPVLRHDLHKAGCAEDFLMAWISVPDLSLHPSPQRYTHLRSENDVNTIRFDAVGEGEDFTAEVQFDGDGLVIDYPGIASRLQAHKS